jgi:outer membrane protein OmpA-like peptidoglycan-associated protein
MTRRAGLAWGMIAVLVFGGCASLPKKKWGMGTTTGALIGAGIGGGAGVGVAAGINQTEGSELARGGAIGAAVGLIVGGLVGHYVFDEDITPVPTTEPVAEATPVPVEPAEVEPLGKVIAVIDVSRFGFNEATVPPSAFPQLDALAAQLQQRPTEQILLEGHTDDVGSDAYNYALGLRRAEAVRDYLATHGVARDRIAVRSEGKRVPVASNATPEGRAKNRRVEVRSMGAAGAGAAPATEPGTEAAPAEVEPVAVAPQPPEAAENEPAAAPPEPAAVAAAAAPSSGALLAPAPEVAPDSAGHATEVVYFLAESHDLNPRAVQVLDNVVAYMRAHPTATVTVTGHIDGVVETNPETAVLRVDRVRLYLISRGILPPRITIHAVGASAPADTSGTQEGLANNRRAELTIDNGAAAAP